MREYSFWLLTHKADTTFKGNRIVIQKISNAPNPCPIMECYTRSCNTLFIHSFGLKLTGQFPCVLGSLLICGDTLEQILLDNQCVPVAQLPWQKPVLFPNLSRGLVDGVLPLLSGTSERIL